MMMMMILLLATIDGISHYRIREFLGYLRDSLW